MILGILRQANLLWALLKLKNISNLNTMNCAFECLYIKFDTSLQRKIDLQDILLQPLAFLSYEYVHRLFFLPI